jgi:general secretion pathway protein D
VLSKPRIQTSHAVEANLFVGRTRPYVTGSSYGGYGGNYSQYQQMQIGITLSVLPLINVDGLVVMDIRQRIQSLGADIKVDQNTVPETIDREANAKVSVRDRETVMLGGFISDSHKNSKSGVPILKDIPILGQLFSSNSKSTDRQELIVLIRPTVLPNPSDAAVTALEEERKLPGISQAKREFKAEENKRLKAMEKQMKKDGM